MQIARCFRTEGILCLQVSPTLSSITCLLSAIVVWQVVRDRGLVTSMTHIPFCFSQVLHCCVCGSSTYTQQSHYTLTLADLSSPDYDPFLPLASVKNSEPVQYHSSADLGNLLTVEEGEILQNNNSHGWEKERL